MIKRFGWTACLILAVSLLAGPVMAAANGETYKARLSVVPLDIAMQTTVAGQGNLTATLAGNRLTVNGTIQGLRSPATDVHIHRGPRGIPGPAILDLSVTKATTATISGTVDLSPSQLADLKDGNLYVQVNSERAPDGNLRGWILP
jgi:CHRD domain